MPRVAIEATLQTPMGAQRLRHLHDEACQRAAQPGFATSEGGPFDATAQTRSAIACGDFNFPSDHPAYGEIQHPLASGAPRYRDAWPLVNGNHPHTPTFCVHDHEYSKTPYCCDFVFVSDDLAARVRRIAVDSETRASDHQPVFVELDDR